MVWIEGKTIVVSGATGNLGAACVMAAHAGGANVAALGRKESALAARFPDLLDQPNMLLAGDVDMRSPSSVENALARVAHRFGRIDAVLNTVGGFAMGGLAESDFRTWADMQTMNLETAVTLTQAAIPELKKSGGGTIVHVGAMAALTAPAGLSAYAASKSGVMRMVEAAAAELAASGIRVNAVLPGIIDTPQNRAAMPDADTSAWVTPEAIADAMLMLTTDAGRAVNGALIPVSGGG